MKVFFHNDFYDVYTSDPAAESGRMESIIEAVPPFADIISCLPANEEDILAAHAQLHIEHVRRLGLYDISARAAGGAIQAARAAQEAPCFAVIRPPGHHASANSCWGFCYFNNMSISLHYLKARGQVERAFVLDFDLHFGDGNVNILKKEPWVEILNPVSDDREAYLEEVQEALSETSADIIAVSAGFDHHVNDWGGLLYTSDYKQMAQWVRETAARNKGGCYGILEGGYNHNVLGENVRAFLEGLDGGNDE